MIDQENSSSAVVIGNFYVGIDLGRVQGVDNWENSGPGQVEPLPDRLPVHETALGLDSDFLIASDILEPDVWSFLDEFRH